MNGRLGEGEDGREEVAEGDDVPSVAPVAVVAVVAAVLAA